MCRLPEPYATTVAGVKQFAGGFSITAIQYRCIMRRHGRRNDERDCYVHRGGNVYWDGCGGARAGAGVVTVNNVPQDFAKFAEGAQAVGSVEQLIAAIEKGIPPASDAATGVTSTEVLMAAYKSVVYGGPVALPLATGENPLTTKKK